MNDCDENECVLNPTGSDAALSLDARVLIIIAIVAVFVVFVPEPQMLLAWFSDRIDVEIMALDYQDSREPIEAVCR